MSILVVGALVVVAFLVLPDLIGQPAMQPQTEQTSPVPSGSIAYAEPKWELTHQFVDNVGQGGWTLTKGAATSGSIGSYSPHEIQVWQAELNEGWPWNLNGTFRINITVTTVYQTVGGEQRRDISVWSSGIIEFTGNQGAYGLLKIHQPTVFLPLEATGVYTYHSEFSALCIFESGTYTESNIATGSINFSYP